MIDQIFRRLQLLFSVGKAVLTGRNNVQASFFDDDLSPNVRHVEPYGFSYFPNDGAEVYGLFVNGDRALGFALITGDKRYKMILQKGEVAIHDDSGNFVHIKRGGVIHVKASAKVIADTPLFEATHDAVVGGNLLVKGNTQSNAGFYGINGGMAEMNGGAKVKGGFEVNGKDVSDGHSHTCPHGGTTSGVM